MIITNYSFSILRFCSLKLHFNKSFHTKFQIFKLNPADHLNIEIEFNY